MRLTAAIAGLAAALAIGGAAQADPLFDLYQSVCVNTLAAPAAATAAAEAQGLTNPPPAQAAQIATLFGADGAGQARVDMKTQRLLVVGTKIFPLGPLKPNVRICLVGMPGAPSQAVKDQLAALAAVPAYPMNASGLETVYIFTEDGGLHAPVKNPDDDKAIAAAIAGGRVRIAFMMASGPFTALAYAIPEK